jgi:hypothetical protein
MKKVITLFGAAICLSFTQHPKAPVTTPSQAASTVKPAAAKFLDFPRGISWSIAYFKDLPMVTLNWPAFTQGGLGPVPFTFQGVTQYVDPTTTTWTYWVTTLTANTSYTMVIGGVNYYFYWNGSSGNCIITGHD